MSFCNTPIQVVDLDECIGLSLATINTNFKLLQDQNCLTYGDIQTIQEDLSSLNTRYTELTSITPRIAKATAIFDGTTTSPIVPLHSYNVTNITRTSVGVYQINYTTAFPNISYVFIGTNNQKATTSPNFSWIQPITFANNYTTINIRDQSGTFVNPEYVSIAVYSL